MTNSALDWEELCCECIRVELARLRGIERALRVDWRGHKLDAADWRTLADLLDAQGMDWPVRTCRAIARAIVDALEKK